MSSDREPLRAVDAAWLRMDSPTNAMVINALLVFREAPGIERIRALVSERLLAHRRFHQRVVEPALGLPHWELDPHFDVRAHLHHLALPAPGDQGALEALVSDLASTPLDRSKPLWQAYLIDGVGSGAALFARLHHSMGDGVSLVRFLLGMTDEGALLAPPEVGVEVPHPKGLTERVKLASAQALTLGHLLMLPPDSDSVLKGELGTQKRIAWSAPAPLDRIKACARQHGAKINDVLVTAVSGALASFLAEQGPVAGLELRALVPVYVRDEVDRGDLGNHFGLVYVPLAIDATDRLDRLSKLRASFDAIKAQPDAVVALGVLGAMGVATSEIEHIGIQLFTRKASVMITNVPGPPVEIHLAGSPLSEMLVWAPVSGHIGLGVSLLSYAGQVRLGIAADAKRVLEPRAIVSAYEAELAALTSTAS
ncbi:MAG: DUF1298 domain-containing protein [Myxococcales bacterium]|nr:DUF1298 domain-containing protein [Myxococcales bacterium]